MLIAERETMRQESATSRGDLRKKSEILAEMSVVRGVGAQVGITSAANRHLTCAARIQGW
jgi:hypothetical protein